MDLAGSAIKQGPYVGRIDCWSLWKPTHKEPLWLLLSGATDPPRSIEISERRTRDTPGDKNGAFLAGITHDLLNMENAVGHYLHNTVKDLQLTKSQALVKIRTLFDECKRNSSKPMLYYTGHGEVGTGNWCFHDGTISIQEILDMVPGGMFYPMIFSDACYSGHWANFCLQKDITGFHCLAACPFYSKAVDTKGEGGDLTLFMTGKKPRPSTEPVYSGGNHNDFPVDNEFDRHSYSDLITAFAQKTRILLSQSLHNGNLSGYLGKSDLYSPTPARACGIVSDYDSFIQLVEDMWNKGYYIYSLACDRRHGFGVFFMKDIGTNQSILAGTSSIQGMLNKGFKITACAARDSTFYLVMTKGSKEYNGKAQSWFTNDSWSDVEIQIQKGYDEQKGISGICYSVCLHKYFVVMTEEPSQLQEFAWFNTSSDAEEWIEEKYDEYLHAIGVSVPVEGKFLAVVTKNENLKVTCRFWNFPLK
ncbi:uncharacterized protein [Montipora foliosa]|uniref:uncharacterized protein n=1 Tax=Montipora foliosa TaxID=591990 RepID=UPI0035F1E825